MFRRLQEFVTLVSTLLPGVFAIFAGVALSAPALATPVVTNFSGTLTTERTFIRPLLPETDYTATWTAADITAGSSSYNYFIQYLEPSVTGNYSIAVTNATGFEDTLLLIYENSFDPARPLVNVLVGNDDQVDTLFSRIDTTLSSGTTYVLVMTTYQPGDAGSVSFSVSGAGSVEYSDEEPVSGPEAPTDIALSNASVNQSGGVNATVGTLSSTDSDSSIFTYSLVSGAGDTGNASFNISGNALRANDAAGLTAASYGVRIRTTDDSGKFYEKAFSIAAVDDVAPAAPTLALDSDSGVSVTDGITNDSTPAISGTAEGASSIVLYDGATAVGSTTANEAGSWSIVSAALDEGPHSLTAKASDVAGNESAASAPLTFSIDVTAPAIGGSAPAAASATDASVDFTVSFAETVYGIDMADFTLAATGTASGTITGVSAASGTSVTVSVGSIEGSGTLRLDLSGGSVVDAAGNVSAAYASGTAHTVDRVAPLLAGVSFDQEVVHSNNQTAIGMTLAGAETGTTAHYAITGPGGAPVTGTAAVSSASQQIGGLDVSGLGDGTLTVSVTLEDASGNASAAVTDTVGKDVALPAVTGVAIASGTYVAGDEVEVSVTLDEDVNIAGSGIALALDLGGATRSAAFTGESGGVLNFVYTIQNGDDTSAAGIGVPADGISLGSATIRDAAGNDADLAFAATSNGAAQVDTEAPAAPGAPQLSAASDSGASASDGITNVNRPTLSGSADAEVDIELSSSVDGVIGATTTDENGSWSLTPGAALSEATHEITAVASDAYGNVSAASAALTVTIDTTAPALGGVAFDQTALDATNQASASFTLSGAEAGATAEYAISGGSGAPLTGSVDVVAASQQVSGLDLSALPDGTLSLSLFLRDVAGNASAAAGDSIAKDIDPVLSLPAAPAPIVDGSTLPLGGVAVSATLSTALEVSLSVDAGALSLDAAGGATIGGNGTAAATVSGGLAAVNAALATLTYAAPENFSGSANLELTVEDGVGSAAGALLFPVYDRPDILGLGGATATYYAGGGAIALDGNADAGVSDQDGPADFDGGSLVVAVVTSPAPAQDVLGFRSGGAVALDPDDGSVLVNDGTTTVSVGTLGQPLAAGSALVIAFNAGATPARLAVLLRSLSYASTGASTGNRLLSLTLNDGTHVDASGSVGMTVSVQNPPDDSGGGNVIDDDQHDNHYTGNVIVTETGVFNGGSVTGTIENRGIVAGEVTLGAGSAIHGGIVAGSIAGNAADPARIDGATVVGGAALRNVIVGADTILEPGVAIGDGVKFESPDSIPAGLDLSGALRTLNWESGDERSVVMLEDDVMAPVGGEDPMTIIRAIQLLDEYEPAGNAVEQNPGNGEIIVVTADSRSAVLPVRVSQAEADEEEGTYIDENGDIVFVTVNRRVVLSYPALADSELFGDLLGAFGLALGFDGRANLVVTPLGTRAATTADGEVRRMSAASLDERYYSARPQVSAVPASSGEEGVRTREVPGLRNATQISFVFRDELGRLMEQDVVPVPADWTALKARLEHVPGLGGLRIDTQGIISVTLNGAVVRGRMGYAVTRSDMVADSPEEEAMLQPAGDANGDGTPDFRVLYPNGDVQLLLIFP